MLSDVEAGPTGVVPGVCRDGKAHVTAWCDVDFKRSGIEKNLNRAPDAKKFADFRVMLEKMDKDIDAVTVVTPDHTHFRGHNGHGSGQARLC